MFNRTLQSFVPDVYDGIVEMHSIINSEEIIMDIARNEMIKAFSNTFVLTSDESGVIMFEKMLNIVSNPKTEDLTFRRHRIINRMTMSPPFTFKFLQQKLDEIIGKDLWSGYIDFDNYTLYVEASATNQNWYSEVEFTINRLKPCNIVFINVPRVSSMLKLSEQVSYTQLNWKYRLGSWKLGRTAFASRDEEGVAKMFGTKSIQPSLLSHTANFVKDHISKILINDSIEVTEFKVREAVDNMVTIEYDVSSEMANLITDLKLFDSEGTLLTQSSVYVPVTETAVVKHTILVKENE